MRFGYWLLLVLGMATLAVAQTRERLDFGRLQTGATVSFTRSTSGEWGLEIGGGPAPRISQSKPARLEASSPQGDVRQLAAGYKTVRKSAEGIDALAEITYSDTAIFRVQDRWTLRGAVLSVRRK